MEESTRYLLLGGGTTCPWAAEHIRQRDPDGRILIMTRDHHPPYDRPPLSKNMLAKDDLGPDDAYTKDDSFYPDRHIDLRTGVTADRVDPAHRAVALDNGDTIRYEKLLLATGSSARKLGVPGSDLRGVRYLRTLDDSLRLRADLQRARRVAIVGAGYIGMEVAADCRVRGLETTIIEQADQPWGRFASPKLGGFLTRYYEAHGVRFRFGEEVAAFVGTDSVAAVHTKGGAAVDADVVVVGVGAALNTELARDGGLRMGDRGGVWVDETLQTSDPHIWAAGDIAFFQDVAMGRRWHVEHHLNAKYQGRAVGAIIAGERKAYDQVPYFYSDFLDLHMILRGDTSAGKDTVVLGDLDGGEFAELYPGQDGVLRMGIAVSHEESNLDPISDRLDQLIRQKARVADLSGADVGIQTAAARHAA